jgi:hypothetical protein
MATVGGNAFGAEASSSFTGDSFIGKNSSFFTRGPSLFSRFIAEWLP